MISIEYIRRILKVAVSQMLQTVGFQSVQSTAMDILIEVLERYIYLLAKSAHEFSEIGN
jgi:transcription initiation factor TFIID subunit 3